MTQNPEELEMSLGGLQAWKGGLFLDEQMNQNETRQERRPERTGREQTSSP